MLGHWVVEKILRQSPASEGPFTASIDINMYSIRSAHSDYMFASAVNASPSNSASTSAGMSSETLSASARRAARFSVPRASVVLPTSASTRAPEQDFGGADGEAVGLVQRDFGKMVEHCQRFFMLTGLVEVFGQIEADLVDGAVFFAELCPESVSGHADVGNALFVPAAAELLAAEIALFDQCAGVVGAVQLAHQFEDFLAGCQRTVTIVEFFSGHPASQTLRGVLKYLSCNRNKILDHFLNPVASTMWSTLFKGTGWTDWTSE